MLNSLLLSLIFITGASVQAQNQVPSAILADTQIVQILKTIDEGEIDLSQRAQAKAQNPEVKNFAASMVDQHKQHKDDVKKVAKRNSIDMRNSDINKALEDEAERAYKDLKNADSESFDRMYIGQQVAMHQRTLDIINGALIPNAKNEELKNFLNHTRNHVTQHLQTAKALQTKIP